MENETVVPHLINQFLLGLDDHSQTISEILAKFDCLSHHHEPWTVDSLTNEINEMLMDGSDIA